MAPIIGVNDACQIEAKPLNQVARAFNAERIIPDPELTAEAVSLIRDHTMEAIAPSWTPIIPAIDANVTVNGIKDAVMAAEPLTTAALIADMPTEMIVAIPVTVVDMPSNAVENADWMDANADWFSDPKSVICV